MVQQIQVRRGTAAAWEAAGSPILAAGEPGFIIDTGVLKLGDGVTGFAQLTGLLTQLAASGIYPTVVNVKGYGAVGDGVTDNLTAILNAIAALGSQGGVIYFPPGVYVVSGTILANQNNIHFIGAGIGSTTISTSSATLPLFDFGDNVTLKSFLTVENMLINSTVTRTGGAFIRARLTVDLNITRCRLVGAYFGIDLLDTQLTRLTDLHILNTVTSVGECIHANSTGAGSNLYLFRVATDAPAGSQPRCGLSVQQWDGLFITDTQFNHSGTGAIFEPVAGQYLSHIFASNSSFDSNGAAGLLFNTSGGTVQRAWFLDCWFGSNETDGITINGGAIALSFIQPKVFANGQNGISIVSATDVEIASPQISGNSSSASGTYDGIAISANVSRIKVLGGDIRPFAGFTNTQRRAITIAAGVSDFIKVRDCNMDGNVTTPGISNGGTGVNNLFRNNPGYVTENKGTVNQPASAGVVGVMHGLDVTPNLQDIRITPCTDLGSATKFYISNITASGFNINTNGAPGAILTWSWAAQV